MLCVLSYIQPNKKSLFTVSYVSNREKKTEIVYFHKIAGGTNIDRFPQLKRY